MAPREYWEEINDTDYCIKTTFLDHFLFQVEVYKAGYCGAWYSGRAKGIESHYSARNFAIGVIKNKLKASKTKLKGEDMLGPKLESRWTRPGYSHVDLTVIAVTAEDEPRVVLKAVNTNNVHWVGLHVWPEGLEEIIEPVPAKGVELKKLKKMIRENTIANLIPEITEKDPEEWTTLCIRLAVMLTPVIRTSKLKGTLVPPDSTKERVINCAINNIPTMLEYYGVFNPRDQEAVVHYVYTLNSTEAFLVRPVLKGIYKYNGLEKW